MTGKTLFLGIDVGSISVNVVLMDEAESVRESLYLRTNGAPVRALQQAFSQLQDLYPKGLHVEAVGVTGSARNLIGAIVGADVIRNEITSHGLAAINELPTVRTVLEIGGQDSKIILIRDGIITDFGMNTVCAAGTGSFLDQQAHRLGLPIEQFGTLAIKAQRSSPIAGRCTVFAESDMIHKQQMGFQREEIIAGLCDALVDNYLSSVAKNKELSPPFIFQGGVAANEGIRWAFEKKLGNRVHIPHHFAVMGAWGAAILAREQSVNNGAKSNFRGFQISNQKVRTRGVRCGRCANNCDVIIVAMDGEQISLYGDRCGRYSTGGDTLPEADEAPIMSDSTNAQENQHNLGFPCHTKCLN